MSLNNLLPNVPSWLHLQKSSYSGLTQIVRIPAQQNVNSSLPRVMTDCWHMSTSNCILYSSLLLVLILTGATWCARIEVQWSHADHTLSLKRLKRGDHVDLLQLCKAATPSGFLHPILSNRHIQTIHSLLDKRSLEVYFRRRKFQSIDKAYEGEFAVDFTVPAFDDVEPRLPPRTAYFEDATQISISRDDSRPLLIVLHGLCGGSHEQYIQHVLAPLNKGADHWEACVLLSRGCGETSITAGGTYYAHATSDVRQLVDWLKTTFPNRPLYGVGFSMGANILTRYVAEEGSDCVLKAAAVVSNPWNLEVTALHLQRTWFGRHIYSPAMTSNLMDVFFRNRKKIKTQSGATIDASQVSLMHEYDRHIQCPIWGFPTERVYYRKGSSSDAVLDVRIPFFAINAEDDPIVGTESIPKEEFRVTEYTVLCTSNGGGHLGWYQWNGQRWYARAMVSFFQRISHMEVDKTALPPLKQPTTVSVLDGMN